MKNLKFLILLTALYAISGLSSQEVFRLSPSSQVFQKQGSLFLNYIPPKELEIVLGVPTAKPMGLDNQNAKHIAGTIDYNGPFSFGNTFNFSTFATSFGNLNLLADYQTKATPESNLAYYLPNINQTRIMLSYRVPARLGKFFQDNRLEIFMHIADVQRLDDSLSKSAMANTTNASTKLIEQNRFSIYNRQVYINPGLSLTTSNFVFEGMVRVPMNPRFAAASMDSLFVPELQGNLGLKYIFE